MHKDELQIANLIWNQQQILWKCHKEKFDQIAFWCACHSSLKQLATASYSFAAAGGSTYIRINPA